MIVPEVTMKNKYGLSPHEHRWIDRQIRATSVKITWSRREHDSEANKANVT